MAFNRAAAAAAASLGVAGGVEGVGKGSDPWGGESGVSWSHLERFLFLVCSFSMLGRGRCIIRSSH